jgi:integrase
MKLPHQEQPRDRVLSDDELRWLWCGCDEIGWPFGSLAKLLLLTAQRRDEVAGMEWSEVDLAKRIWTIPKHKAKNGRAHQVHLSDETIEVLRTVTRVGDRLALSTTGVAPISGFSRSKRRLDAAMAETRRKELGLPFEKEGCRYAIPNWTLHDLRRTATTGMARLRFPPHVVDKVLNHTGGTIRGVAAIYNQFSYLDERRAALEAWGRQVTGLVTPGAANVVALRAS